MVKQILLSVVEKTKKLQNSEMLTLPISTLLNMSWHCKGNPYGGPTIDADGTLRVCGYRKGQETSKFTIFDLPEKEEQWKNAVYTDAMKCPGCAWSCAWMYSYWKVTNADIGTTVFTNHQSPNIQK